MAGLKISFAGYQKPGSIHTQAAVYFGQQLEERLGEEVSFELTANVSALGYKQHDMIRLVGEGVFDICYVTTSFFTSNFVPEFGVLDLPFLFDSQEQAYRVIDGELGKDLANKINSQSPYQWLGYWDNGMRHFSNSVRPIRTPADCEGLRIRTLTSPLHAEAFKALKMIPEEMDIATLLARADAGTIDAQENPLTNTFNFEIQKRQPFITMSGHFWTPAALLANKEAYSGWPETVKEAVQQAADSSTKFQRKLALAEDHEILADLESPVQVIHLTPDERAAFATATSPVVRAHQEAFGPALDLIRH